MKCKICNNNNKNLLLQIKKSSANSFDFFEYIHCSECWSLSLKNIPTNQDSIYEKYYSFDFNKFKKSRLNILVKKLMVKYNKRLYFLEGLLSSIRDLNFKSILPLKINKASSVLDIGCGAGEFILDLYKCGFKNLLGIDLHLSKNNIIDENVKVLKLDFFDLEENFDLITMHHSLEHMKNIDLVMKKTSELLSANGTCVVRMPNIDSYSFRKFKNYWASINPPYHISLPSMKAFKIIIENSNLEIFDTTGEQTTEMFLANIENELNLVNLDIIFSSKKHIKKAAWFNKKELQFWRKKAAQIRKSPELCEWIVYYLRRKK